MIIAVDPGASGAIAWKRRGLPAECCGMPETRGDAITALRRMQMLADAAGEPLVGYHEKVANYVECGGASAMMQFGRNAERCACIMETLGIPLVEIAPQAWQKALGLGKSERVKCDADAGPEAKKKAREHNAKAKRDWKNKLKAEAQRRFPHLKVTLGNADALLILAAALSLPENSGEHA